METPTPDQIIAARKSLGLTQTEAASVIYRTLRNWQQWESNERRMNAALWEMFLIKSRLKKRIKEKELQAALSKLSESEYITYEARVNIIARWLDGEPEDGPTALAIKNIMLGRGWKIW